MEENRTKLINYWLKTAKEDLKVVDHLFEKEDYTEGYLKRIKGFYQWMLKKF